jgi:biotin synthase
MFYGKIITTRTLQDRIDTLGARCATSASRSVVGGIIGMGESVDDRLGMLVPARQYFEPHPESVPINLWNEVKGVPVNDTAERPDPIAQVRPDRGRPHP